MLIRNLRDKKEFSNFFIYTVYSLQPLLNVYMLQGGVYILIDRVYIGLHEIRDKQNEAQSAKSSLANL
jgi:hypothetical protein